jgi:hypothetical protein
MVFVGDILDPYGTACVGFRLTHLDRAIRTGELRDLACGARR